ncbi:hypothetical protein TTHERM_000629909 (macronuclear) [Tetrahymena thermophila SB210]|uniref:Uncharacterized protein n=1 Tax=Tetrahymena thermophila (strain SB210) TaxID=312017 RepID=W7XF06_TETTS|nr:hypothetical protein TTHERM_000629909 [Tetrahymena thermophila SB210]EWS72576.1 hypothetical protein TTHERM_000629909 [Tetrahymena thermophila SB210]|eukprot:XP_012654859.1 hypothetical protein TTHERM_000629909 [Tetrahymena thermophila SB210]
MQLQFQRCRSQYLQTKPQELPLNQKYFSYQIQEYTSRLALNHHLVNKHKTKLFIRHHKNLDHLIFDELLQGNLQNSSQSERHLLIIIVVNSAKEKLKQKQSDQKTLCFTKIHQSIDKERNELSIECNKTELISFEIVLI